MHQELLHVHSQLDLALILHLVQVHQLLMSHNLILIMSERIEKEGPVIAKSRIYNLKLNEHT